MKHPTILAIGLGLGAALTGLSSAHAVGTTGVVYQNAGRYFASAVTTRAQAGWRLLDLSVKDAEDSDRSAISVVMLLGSRQLGERATITFSRETGNVWSSVVEPASLPHETRHYTNEAELFSALKSGAVTGFEWGCTYIYLDTENGGVVLDTDAYFVVNKKLKGRAAQEALADELAHHLLAGDTLADVALQDAEGAKARGPASPGRHASVKDDKRAHFQIVAQRGGHLELVAEIEGHKVVGLEVREYPGLVYDRVYHQGQKLAERVHAAGAVVGVIESGGEITLDLKTTGAFHLSSADFELFDRAKGAPARGSAPPSRDASVFDDECGC